jgi:hypothetical protein
MRPLARLALCAGVSAAALALVSTPALAQRQSGIQLTPDSARYLISKDVGTDRWAISYNLNDKTVTGNVFPAGGGTPQFISCVTTQVDQDPNPENSMYHLHCVSTPGPCTAAPCSPSAWGGDQDVLVPGSFLLPPNTMATFAGNVEPITSGTCAVTTACHQGTTNGLDLQQPQAYSDIFLVPAAPNSPKNFIQPFDTSSSYIMDKLTGAMGIVGSKMPLGGQLSQDQLNDFTNWILEGAANN